MPAIQGHSGRGKHAGVPCMAGIGMGEGSMEVTDWLWKLQLGLYICIAAVGLLGSGLGLASPGGKRREGAVRPRHHKTMPQGVMPQGW